jgi:hypothetical protein
MYTSHVAPILGIKQVDLVTCLTCLVAWLFKQLSAAIEIIKQIESAAKLDLANLSRLSCGGGGVLGLAVEFWARRSNYPINAISL